MSIRTPLIALFLMLLLLLSLSTCGNADVNQFMERYLWEDRVLVLFSPSLEEPAYREQIQDLENAAEALAERDVLIIHIIRESQVKVDGESKPQLGTPAFYEHFNVSPPNFAVLLIGKDGGVKLRQNKPLTIEKLTATIDAMPMRQQEMQQ